MSRYKKEEMKKYREARKGLTADEVAALDAREAAEKAFEEEVRQMHLNLFPEEYDHIYDDSVDAARRRQGISPMSDEYVRRTDARRAALGFAAFADSVGRQDTLSWVRQMMRDGRAEELERVCRSHNHDGDEAGG